MVVQDESDDIVVDVEADLRFVLLVLSGIEDVGSRLRWVQENLPRTAQLIGADIDLLPPARGDSPSSVEARP